MTKVLSRKQRSLPRDVRARYLIHFNIPKDLSEILQQEAIRLSSPGHGNATHGKRVSVNDVVRALIGAYIEKRRLGLILNPDD